MTTSCSDPATVVFLGLGSNQEHRDAVLDSAILRLSSILDGIRVSSFYQSDPLYVTEQPSFLNAVVAGCTTLSPRALLSAVNDIERSHGRDRRVERPKGPRTLDIDILLYGDRRISESDLQIPHPGMMERRFVLEPLLEIAPDLVHPVTGEQVSAVLERLDPQGVYLWRCNPYNG
ncbi:MAG: 2-amino-4-hydroxy-6-hydroxymethyldihydropteridine diphosphokinase [Spirochaetaceae bacterium]|nr:MAG: 2-amino-4-hydroxy-6-hydroxymethyldihydropteridine diphosphokinase [Spirochaetaceae bacterium]